MLTHYPVSRNIGWQFLADNGKGKKDLGMAYRPLEKSVINMFQQMIDIGIIESS